MVPMSRSTFRKSFTCLFFCGMRFSRSVSNVSRDAAAAAIRARTSAARRICLLRRRQKRASASRSLSVKLSLALWWCVPAKLRGDSMRSRSSQGLILALALLGAACQRAEPLTAAKADQILRGYLVSRVPAYAEVPQKVWWNASAPKDDFDEKSVRTLRNLERAGLVTVTESQNDGTTTYLAKVTAKGFPILGTAPSLRGPAFRGLICYKVYDGIRNFQRHPTEPTVGHAELLWHYIDPTPLYPLFETK